MYYIYNQSIKYSGNNTTLTRLSKILNLPTTNIIKDKIIGIHAYKFGKKSNRISRRPFSLASPQHLYSRGPDADACNLPGLLLLMLSPRGKIL